MTILTFSAAVTERYTHVNVEIQKIKEKLFVFVCPQHRMSVVEGFIQFDPDHFPDRNPRGPDRSWILVQQKAVVLVDITLDLFFSLRSSILFKR